MGSIIMSVGIVAIGVAIGLARGGRIDALLAVRPRWWGLLVSGFALQALAENVDVPAPASVSVIGMFALVVGLIMNAPIRGALIAAFGVTINLVVLVLNGAVPIRFEALVEAGLVDSSLSRADITSVGRVLELETDDSRLASLGDTIPVAFLDSVISIGDLVTFAGVIVIVSNLIAARRSVGVPVGSVFEPIEEVVELAEPEPEPTEPESTELPEPIQLDTSPLIDLTFDPDDIWADNDTGVRVLGPSAKSNP